MQTLYELPEAFAPALERYEMFDFEDAPESDMSLALSGDVNAIAMKAEDKVAGLVRWRENLLAEAEALDGEMSRLKGKRDAKKRAAEGIKRFLCDLLRVLNASKFNAGVRSLHFRKGSTSVVVDESQVENWSPEFFDAAVKNGALIARYDVKVSILKTMDGYLTQPGVEERTGEETLVIK